MQTFIRDLRTRLHDETGEGVISTGIVVLIMALLGAAMWVAFSGVMDSAADRAEEGVENIGSGG